MKSQLKETEFRNQGALRPFLIRIFKYSFRYKKWFIPFIFTISMTAIADALFPMVWLNFIDNAVTPMAELAAREGLDALTDFSGLYIYGLMFLGLTLVQVLSTGVFIYFSGRIEEYVVYDLRKDMFNKLQRLSFSYYDRSAIGWLVARITSDTDRVTELISWGFLSLIWGIVMILSCFFIMISYHWQLAMVVVLMIPLLLLVSIKLRLRVLDYSRKARKINSEMIATFSEHVNGIEVNKVTGQELSAAARFGGVSENMRKASFRSTWYSAMYGPLVVMIGSLAAALVIYMGGHMVLAEYGITLGMLAAFFGYAQIIFEPIFDITRFYALAQSSLSAGERIFDLINEKVEIGANERELPDFRQIEGRITFNAVDFHYVADKPIFRGLNLDIRPGHSVALVGPTGEGKSTLTSLVSRFYEPVEGKIEIDGVDYRRRTLESLRRQLGIILQAPHLFSGSLADNIRYGDHNAERERIEHVLTMIGAVEMIPRLDEEVGEEGSNLSLGEKQLVSFARVILKDPKILIMDEATASVDTIAEIKIQKGIEQLIRGRTSIIIAHRLSTIKHCDRILVIRQGGIIEDGNHDELIARRGYYHKLYTGQVRQGAAAS